MKLFLGSLIEETTIDWEGINCSVSKKTETVNIAALYKEFSDAEEACNKFVYGSMTANFQVNKINKPCQNN